MVQTPNPPFFISTYLIVLMISTVLVEPPDWFILRLNYGSDKPRWRACRSLMNVIENLTDTKAKAERISKNGKKNRDIVSEFQRGARLVEKPP